MDYENTQRTELTPDDWSRGAPNAPVTLLEYADFECPHCASARPELEALLESHPSVFRLVFRHFPVQTTHPHALQAAEAAEAAGAQGKFWQMHDLLFEHQDALELEDLREYAAALALDQRRFDHEMARHVHVEAVKNDFRRGVRDGVNGTPTLFIDGVRYDGPRDRDAILAVVAEQSGGGAEPWA
jgi:protein-disulfide isomerase